jgi:riboflavin synthase
VFTGIVSAMGTITSVSPLARGVRLSIGAPDFGLSDVAIGDSIAISGACLTVVEKSAQAFGVDVSQETLRCTHGLEEIGAKVNLEKALTLSDRLGGHLVTGHVDGVGEVAKLVEVGESWELTVRPPAQLSKYIAPKGSITVDGVSLTVNEVDSSGFKVNIIAHTRQVTTIGELAVGAKVNLEVDLIARYLERLLLEQR